MAQRLRSPFVVTSLMFAFSLVFGESASAQTIWSGLTKSFSKADFTDANLPENQDALTANVILTRGSSGGMINIAAESFYNQLSSPALTLWATDKNNPGKTIAATNFQDLAFTDWIDAYGGSHTGGAFIENRDAVVKLVSDNIVLDLRFTSWTAGTGGGYSYLRAEPPAPTGDYNGNGSVDAGDYVVWRRTLGRTGIAAGSGADGNSNEQIDSGDYTYWRLRFGNPASGSGLGVIANVPEPCAAVCAVFGCGFLFAARSSRRLRSISSQQSREMRRARGIAPSDSGAC
jgi:hypothetical protein